MRKLLSVGFRLLPVAGCLWGYGCGVTDRQLVDFLSSTSIRVVIQSISDVLQATIVSNATGT
jgi:hypothetical protein